MGVIAILYTDLSRYETVSLNDLILYDLSTKKNIKTGIKTYSLIMGWSDDGAYLKFLDHPREQLHYPSLKLIDDNNTLVGSKVS
jgi:hypothetical protein